MWFLLPIFFIDITYNPSYSLAFKLDVTLVKHAKINNIDVSTLGIHECIYSKWFSNSVGASVISFLVCLVRVRSLIWFNPG